MDKAVKKAMSYLEDNIHECQDVFVTAITAQALTLSKSNRRNDMFYTLSKMNTTSMWPCRLYFIFSTSLVGGIFTQHKTDIFSSV